MSVSATVLVGVRTASARVGRLLSCVAWIAVAVLSAGGNLAAQEEKAAARRAAGDEGQEREDPVDVSGNELITPDGVVLKATYFQGAGGKASVPVILLHSWKGGRWEYAGLAKELWDAGCTVLAPDLRGHGQSKTQYVGGSSRELDAAKFVAGDFARMVQYDMETLKKFLVKKNNDRKLNLEKLCVVGAEMGASVATNWALLDWSWPNYAGVKQGQSVKALVLLSPQRNFHGLNITEPLRNPLLNAGVSMMLLVGNEDPKLLKEVQGIHANLERFHRTPPEGREETEQTLFFKGLDTKAQGAKLLADPDLNVPQRIRKFIDLRLAKPDYPWIEIGKKRAATPAK